MKKLFFLFVFFSWIPSLHAEVACTKHDKPCDRKEDCMYERQISMKKQLLELYADPALRQQAMDQAQKEFPGNDSTSQFDRSRRARDIFQKLLEQKAHDGKTIKLPSCKGERSKNPTIRDPYSMYTDQNCEMHYVNDKDQEVSKDAALGVNTCEEFNSAARVHELWHVSRCQWAKNNPSAPAADRQDLDTYIIEEMEAYYHEIAYLREEKSWRKQRCTPTKEQSKDAGSNAKRLIQKISK